MNVGHESIIAATGSDISANILVGKYCSIGPYVQMHAMPQHACIEFPRLVSTKQLKDYPPVKMEDRLVIGNDVWVGRNAVLLGNITIGDGAIIGAYAVVAKDIPDYAIVVGNPAKIIRYRFTPEQIEQLLKIAWWDWPDAKVEKHKKDFLDIDVFLKKHYN